MPKASISIVEPVTSLKRIPILECCEPLVDYLKLCPELVHLPHPRYAYHRETLLRRSVAEKLCRAARSLPRGLRLGIIEGWRSPYIQRRMYLATWKWYKENNSEWSETKLRRRVNSLTAPMHPQVPPPHTTGAAIDLALTDESGRQMDHISPFERFDSRAFRLEAPNLSEPATNTRRILKQALESQGITNYPNEYWHWSYGDQGWAYRGGHSHAIYDAVSPHGWEPAPEDRADTPLEVALGD